VEKGGADSAWDGRVFGSYSHFTTFILDFPALALRRPFRRDFE